MQPHYFSHLQKTGGVGAPVRAELPPFHFHAVDLFRNEETHWQALFSRAIASEINRTALGTQIWWGTTHTGEQRCLKEFYLADPTTFSRSIPDPVWRKPPSQAVPDGQTRGLMPRRASLFDQMQDGTLKEEVIRAGGQHTDFRSQFNAYSFEVEALITQFARHYNCNQLVKTQYWGPLLLPNRGAPRYVIEMEKLSTLPLPSPMDNLAILHRLIEMMTAVTQLHSMLLPIRCYPPELISDLNIARMHPITRPFHYDLSPDQFMLRQETAHAPQQVVLLDFNASRTAQTEYSTFSWRTIPGKDYYQPPERRAQVFDTESIVFQSNPVYDLYSLLVIGMFLFLRKQDWQQRIQQIAGWESLDAFYQYLFADRLAQRLALEIPSNRGIQAQPLLALMEAVLQHRPEERYVNLLELPKLQWHGQSDWMLLPKVADYLAREAMGRQFRVGWRRPHLQVQEGDTPLSLLEQIDASACHWRPGSMEEGRIPTPPFRPDALRFLQAESTYPLLRDQSIDPQQAGVYTIYACWQGCIDRENPLYIEVTPAQSGTHYPQVSPPQEQPNNAYPTRLELPSAPPAPAEPHATPPQTGAFVREDAYSPLPASSQPVVSSTPARVSLPTPSTPPSASRAPSQGTVNFNREEAFTPPPAHTIVTPPPASQAFEIPAISVDEALSVSPRRTTPRESVPPHATTDIKPATPSDEETRLIEWLDELQTCDSLQRLNFMEAYLQNAPREGLPFQVLINLRTRRCQLALDRRALLPASTPIKQLAQLVAECSPHDLHKGLVLNNLAVCCYQSAYANQTMPRWEDELGFDPLSEIQRWLHQTDPNPSREPSPRMWEIRERSRETLDYCRKIKRSLVP